MFRNLIPKEVKFFDYFESHISITVKIAEEIVALSKGELTLEKCSSQIKSQEKELDEITHKCLDSLDKTFITPFERTDIHKLIKRMDDIADSIEAAISRCKIYKLEKIRPDVKVISEKIHRATIELEQAIKGLREMHNSTFINQKCVNVHNLENEVDDYLDQALGELFNEKDPILIIKWKEILENLEDAMDMCQDTADVIERIVISAS